MTKIQAIACSPTPAAILTSQQGKNKICGSKMQKSPSCKLKSWNRCWGVWWDEQCQLVPFRAVQDCLFICVLTHLSYIHYPFIHSITIHLFILLFLIDSKSIVTWIICVRTTNVRKTTSLNSRNKLPQVGDGQSSWGQISSRNLQNTCHSIHLLVFIMLPSSQCGMSKGTEVWNSLVSPLSRGWRTLS